MNYVDSLQKLR